MKIRLNVRQKFLGLLIQHSSSKHIFFFYYSYIIKATSAKLNLKNELKTTINTYGSNNSFNSKGSGYSLNNSIELDTVSYVETSRSIIASLEKGFTLPAYNPPIKIMPLGDSITYGIMGTNDRNSGGYRTELWNKFVADGLKVEFVGSKSSGPDSQSNRAHEGHPGWTIKMIAGSVNEWLTTYQPDIVLLMIGTNDAGRKSLKIMIEELSALIDQITAHSPHTQLLVSSIPPIHPTAKPVIRGLRAIYFNTAIPIIVNSKIAQGKKVDFVDMRDLTVNDLTSSLSLGIDSGLHPNAQGYSKIANFWYDAVFKVISKRPSDTISAI